MKRTVSILQTGVVLSGYGGCNSYYVAPQPK